MATAVLFAGSVVTLWRTAAEPQTTGKPTETPDKPNIVFVLTDDQMPGTENNMPSLKNNITEEGITFSNMTSTFPLCCPGRATIQRGQYAHNTKIYGNSPLDGGWRKFRAHELHKSTVATWLDRADYQTGIFGKYMNNYRDKVIPLGWDHWYVWNGPKMGWTSVNDQGKERPLERQQADSLVADRALRFLSNHLKNEEPVFAFVNFGAMHSPFHHGKIDADRFKGEDVPRTPSFNEPDVSDKPEFVRTLPKLSEKDISKLDRRYREGLRSLMRVDRFIGQATDLLQRKDELDDTFFIFYTDNGAHFGQHRFMHGKLQPYEEDVNFPLIIRGPGIPPGVVKTELVGNHDIAPTLADIGNASVPSFVDGRSFLPLATDTTTQWPRTAILSERENDDKAPNMWDMLRMEGKIYTRHEGGGKEYYDLASDPYQLHNLFRPDQPDPPPPPNAATIAYYEQRLDDLYHCSGQSCRTAENAPLLP